MSRGTTVCSHKDCPNLAGSGHSLCPDHEPKAWATSTRRARLPRDWPRTVRRILARDRHRCYLCSAYARQVDHIVSGDDHSDSNLAAICDPCHATKSAREGNAARNARREPARARTRRLR